MDEITADPFTGNTFSGTKFTGNTAPLRSRHIRSEEPDPLDFGPEQGAPKKYYLEAIIIAGIVAASYVNAAIYLLH